MLLRVVAICALLVMPVLAKETASFKTAAKTAILIDAKTGKILFEKNAHAQMEPASMTKMMTAYMIFERLKAQRLSLQDEFTVSPKAWRKGGSKMFVRAHSKVDINNLLQGILTLSGNDACIVVAEGLFGSEEAFAREMTIRAHEMGVSEKTVFKNATGWPDEGHVTTVADLALIAYRTINDFPEFYKKYYAQREFTYNGIRQTNRNPLLYNRHIEADGLKTGETDSAGSCIAASAIKGDRRLIMVLGGLKTRKERARESESMLMWGFREFDNKKLFKTGEAVVHAPTWLGSEAVVPLTVEKDLTLVYPRTQKAKVDVEVVYDKPVAAPIKQGQRLGEIIVSIPGMGKDVYPLVAAMDVSEGSVFQRIFSALEHLIFGN